MSTISVRILNRPYRKDTVELHHPLRDFPQNLLTVCQRRRGAYHIGSYRAMEKSWEEQRAYLDRALIKLPVDLKATLNRHLSRPAAEISRCIRDSQRKWIMHLQLVDPNQ